MNWKKLSAIALIWLSCREHVFHTANCVQVSKLSSCNTHFQVSSYQVWFNLWLLMPNLKTQTFVFCCFKLYFLRTFDESIILKDNFFLPSDWDFFPLFCQRRSLRDVLWLILLWWLQMWICQIEPRQQSQGHMLPTRFYEEASSSDRGVWSKNIFRHNCLCTAILF